MASLVGNCLYVGSYVTVAYRRQTPVGPGPMSPPPHDAVELPHASYCVDATTVCVPLRYASDPSVPGPSSKSQPGLTTWD